MPTLSDLGDQISLDNYLAATQQMKLTPQEQDLYLRHLANLYGPGGVDNPNGSRSTLYQMSADVDGQTYNLPTVYGGRILSPQDAMARARQLGLQSFPSYPSAAQAEARYQQMHNYMDADVGRFLDLRRGYR